MSAPTLEEKSTVATMSPWHSIRNTLVALAGIGAPGADGVYHDDDECPYGDTVELRYREAGTGHLPHCDECRRRENGAAERAAPPHPDYPVPVVDSALYQDALDAIAQNSGDARGVNGGARGPGDHYVMARVVPEPDVVRVVIRGLRVGYLNSEDAQRYRQHLPDAPRSVPAMIVGRWDWDPRKPGTRCYEVWLALRLRP